MPSVRVEDRAFTDPRITRLGIYLKRDEFYALGAMTHVWRLCTDLETPKLDPEDVDALVRCDGFAAAMVKAKLAVMDGDVLHVRGTEGRIEWLSDRRAASKKGGEATKRRAEAKRVAKYRPNAEPNDSQKASLVAGQTKAKLEPNAGPNGGPLALALALAPVKVSTLSQKKPATVRPAALEVAKHLLAAIRSHKPDFEPRSSVDTWAKQLPDKQLAKAHRLMAAADFAHRTDPRGFWRGNILSCKKLLEHLDTLEIQAKGGRGRVSTQQDERRAEQDRRDLAEVSRPSGQP